MVKPPCPLAYCLPKVDTRTNSWRELFSISVYLDILPQTPSMISRKRLSDKCTSSSWPDGFPLERTSLSSAKRSSWLTAPQALHFITPSKPSIPEELDPTTAASVILEHSNSTRLLIRVPWCSNLIRSSNYSRKRRQGRSFSSVIRSQRRQFFEERASRRVFSPDSFFSATTGATTERVEAWVSQSDTSEISLLGHLRSYFILVEANRLRLDIQDS